MATRWFLRARDSSPVEARLSFDRHTLIVHRHRDESPDQWVYSCHSLGEERKPIGDPGDTIETAQRLAVEELQRNLDFAAAALRTAVPS